MPASRSTTVRVAALAAAVGLVPFGLALVGSFPAAPPPASIQAAATVGTGSYAPAWVALTTGTGSSITLNTASGRLGAAQTLAPAADCGVNQGPAATRFLTLQGATARTFSEGLASYQSGSVGVKEKKSGTSCYQVNAVTTEQLSVGLGAGVATLVSPTAVASSAYLDLELKQSARILATLSLGNDVKGSYELQSGATIGQPKLAGTTGEPFTCNNPADSGPDSGVNDNCRWPISVPSWTGTDDGVFFDTISLKAVSGAFSLEGGGDGTVLPQSPTSTPNASIVEIVDGTIGCGGQTRTEAATGDEPRVVVRRIDNVGGAGCAAVPYSLANGPQFGQFLKPLATQPSAQFVWDLTWLMPQAAGTTDLPDVKVDYETPDASGASPLVTLGWCPDATYTSTGTFAGYSPAQVAALPDQDDYAGTQYACIVSRTATSVDGSPDRVRVNDLVYVLGDAKMQW